MIFQRFKQFLIQNLIRNFVLTGGCHMTVSDRPVPFRALDLNRSRQPRSADTPLGK
jgi:hypothetical protein